MVSCYDLVLHLERTFTHDTHLHIQIAFTSHVWQPISGSPNPVCSCVEEIDEKVGVSQSLQIEMYVHVFTNSFRDREMYTFLYSIVTSQIVLLQTLPLSRYSEIILKVARQRGLNNKGFMIVFFLGPTKPLPSYNKACPHRRYSLKVFTNEKRGGERVISFDRPPFTLLSRKFSKESV